MKNKKNTASLHQFGKQTLQQSSKVISLYLQVTASLKLQRSFFVQLSVINQELTLVTITKSVCGMLNHKQDINIILIVPESYEHHRRERWKDCKIQRSGRTRAEQHLLVMAGPLHSRIHSSYVCLHRTCGRPSQSTVKHQQVRHYGQLMTPWGDRVNFL